jgi:hypothetical protein
VTGAVYGRAAGWPKFVFDKDDPKRRAKIATTAYFDAVNFARRIKVPGHYGWGYNDETCPPTSTFSAYNVIVAPKQLTIIKEMGGITPTGDLTQVRLVRGGAVDPGNVLTVAVLAAVRARDFTKLPQVHPRDIIRVPTSIGGVPSDLSASESEDIRDVYYILGAVARPGVYKLESRLDLIEALALAVEGDLFSIRRKRQAAGARAVHLRPPAGAVPSPVRKPSAKARRAARTTGLGVSDGSVGQEWRLRQRLQNQPRQATQIRQPAALYDSGRKRHLRSGAYRERRSLEYRARCRDLWQHNHIDYSTH